MLKREFGFDTRHSAGGAGSYDGRMYWVVETAGITVVVRVDENHFARKHLLLPSTDANKITTMDDWGIKDLLRYWWSGVDNVRDKYDTYTDDKSLHRVEHRAKVAPFQAGAVAAVGTPTPIGDVTPDRVRWSDKYRGRPLERAEGPLAPGAAAPTQRNSVVNLVAKSSNSIERARAAGIIAATLAALPVPMGPAVGPGGVALVQTHAGVQIDFGTNCIINTSYTSHGGAVVDGYAQGIRVDVHETPRAGTKRSFSIYHLTGTF